MLSRQDAERIAEEALFRMPVDCPVAIHDACTQEHDFGWVFFYRSVENMEAESSAGERAGTTPFIVDRIDGSVYLMSTERPLSDYLESYRAARATRQEMKRYWETIAPRLVDALLSKGWALEGAMIYAPRRTMWLDRYQP